MLDPKTGINFPFYQSQVQDIFGMPDEDGEFAKGYLRTLDFTEFAQDFAHVKDYEGGKWGCKIYGNYIIEDPLRAAFRDVCEQGLAGELKIYSGCFNIRQAKGGNFLSMHSFGIALDFNAPTNPFREDGTLVTDFSDEFVMCFARYGWEWGGIWDRPKDPMHFQACIIKDRSGPLAPIPWVPLAMQVQVPTTLPEMPVETSVVEPQVELPIEESTSIPVPEVSIWGWIKNKIFGG